MALACPTCRARVQPAAPRPGRFRAACPACGAPFGVAVPADPAAAWAITPLPARPATAGIHRSGHRGQRFWTAAAADRPTVATVTPPAGDGTPLPPHRLSRPAGSVPEAVSRDAGDAGPPRSIPGYRIDRPLGRGGMGTVYLGRQLSLDRPVALKVMSRQWSEDAVFVARFTREAFAAALLNHPNVVQIYDIGEADGLRFFSMEYVPGRNLADQVKLDGKLDCETAVGYVLQAARGLRHAHERGMIHRDVKPDNLLLDDHGCVKVADLGLVKTPRLASPDRPDGPADLTGTRMALGTPAYMAPEQCRDAATVDHRADIYALGATLYVLVTGRPPFDGASAVELMTQHAYEPLVPPEAIVGRVPKELSAVILKMLAKSPDDRFASMAEVVRTLEQWLGVTHAGPFHPTDEQIDQLDGHVRAFHAAPTAVLKARVVTAAVSGLVLGAVLLMFFGRLGWAFGLAGLVLHAAAAYFVLNGVANKTYLFRRVRQSAFGLGTADWAVGAAGVGLFAALLWLLGLLGLWAGFGLLGTAAALAVRLGFDRAIDAERAAPLAACGRLLRRMRLHGPDEDDLRQFVAKYAGRQWEEFFEALFGFEAKLQARALLARGCRPGVRDTFAAWREPVVYLIDRLEKTRREAGERAMLERVERAGLVAAGVASGAAHAQAEVSAAALIRQADAARDADARRRTATGPPPVPNLATLLARGTAPTAGPAAGRDWLSAAVGLVAGPPVRAVLAGVLLAGCGLWMKQDDPTAPLTVDGLPAAWTGWVDSANAGWAGLLLVGSLFVSGHRSAVLMLVGAGVCVLGPRLGIRTVEPVQHTQVALMLGGAFGLVGVRLGRRG